MEIFEKVMFRFGLVLSSFFRQLLFSIFYFVKEGGFYYAASATYFLMLGLLPSVALLAQLIYRPLMKLDFFKDKIGEWNSVVLEAMPEQLVIHLSKIETVISSFLNSVSFSFINAFVFLGFLLAFVRSINFGLEKFLKLKDTLSFREKLFSLFLLTSLCFFVFLASFLPYFGKLFEDFALTHVPHSLKPSIEFVFSTTLSNFSFVLLFIFSFGFYELFFHHLKRKGESLKAAAQFVLSLILLKIFFVAIFSGVKFESFKVLGQLLYTLLLGILWVHSIILSFYLASVHFLDKDNKF